MRNFYKILLFITLFIAIGQFCDKKTKGFSLYKIAPNSLAEQGPNPSLEIDLSQPYYFLGRGGQSFAFVSKDGKTVIKFFKYHQMHLLEWFKNLNLPAVLNPYREKILKKHRHRSSLLFESCKIANTEFKDRTGLIYLHLHKTDHFKKKLTIVDTLGISHQVDLDTTPFALQTRAEPAYRTFKRLLAEKNIEGAKKCIDSVLNLIVERFQKGIADRDPNIRRNFGFVGDKAIEIDLGSYTKRKKEAPLLKTELLQKTRKFQKWLSLRNQELFLHLSERIEQLEKNPSTLLNSSHQIRSLSYDDADPS